MRVNFTDTADTDFEALPAGTYTVKVTGGELKESGPNSKNPGSEYINWEFEVTEGDFSGRKLWSNTTLLAHALFSIKGLLAATGRFGDMGGELDFEIDDVIGADLQVVVKQREYDGEMRNEIKKFRTLGDSVGASSSNLP